jgi:DNA-binding transcriptional MerR regulator
LDKAPDAFRTISEVADELDIPQHVLRFWETRFAQIRPMKRGGGRRYYRPDDVDLLRGIRHLLYGEGYTIRGVQRILRDQGVRFVQGVWQAGAVQPTRHADDDREEEAADAAPAEPAAAPGRRGGLFGLLPGRGEEPSQPATEPEPEPAPQRREPSVAPPTVAAPAAEQRPEPIVAPPAAPPSTASLAREDLRKLQASLHELNECRRLLDGVLADQG